MLFKLFPSETYDGNSGETKYSNKSYIKSCFNYFPGCNANFQCNDGSCLHFANECDGNIDCADGEDEGHQCK